MAIPSRPMAYLYTSDSDSDVDSDVKLVRVPYEGSHPRRALVKVQGIPAYGVVEQTSLSSYLRQ